MIIKFYKKITSTMRNRNKLLNFKKKYISNIYYKTIHSKSGRNKTGKQTIYTKKNKIKKKSPIYFINFLYNLKFFYLKWVNFDTKLKKKTSIIATPQNNIFLLPSIYGVVIGSFYTSTLKFFNYFNKISFGLPCYLKIIPNFYKISNIIVNKKNKPSYCVSSGCFSTKLAKKKKDKLYKITLPSKKIKYFKGSNICFIGKNNVSEKKLFKPGKAGYNQLIGYKSTVRGVAKNPVDHPNGGRTKSCSPEKSPWGWIAKLNK